MPAKQCRTYDPASCVLRLRALASCITDSLVKRNLNHQALHASRTCPAACLSSCHPTDPIGHNTPRPRWILTGLTYTSWQTGVVSTTSPPLHHPPAPGTWHPAPDPLLRPLLLSHRRPAQAQPSPPKPPQTASASASDASAARPRQVRSAGPQAAGPAHSSFSLLCTAISHLVLCALLDQLWLC